MRLKSLVPLLAVVTLWRVNGEVKKEKRNRNFQEICQLDSDTGPCRAALSRWFFNKESQECESFIYGGCHGNRNKFPSKALCERRCKGSAGGACPKRKCRKRCEFGFIEDAQGCRVCACKRDPNAPPCPEIECPNRCPNGYLDDENGCTTCFCRETSPAARSPRSTQCPPVCLMFCQFGNKQDENGCDICECYTKEEVCGSHQCRLHCPGGFLTDSRGCDLCECRPADYQVVQCSPVTCMMNCPFGFAKDSFGCDTCLCAGGNTRRRPVDCSLRPSCNMYCPFGFLKDRHGCDRCKCARRNSGRHLGRAGSRRRHRPATDVCGERPMCAMFCEHGFKKDQRGCDLCECNDLGPAQLPAAPAPPAAVQLPTVNCPSMAHCKKYCAFGFAKDDYGCEQCICRDSRASSHSTQCPNFMCLMYCEHGFQKDSNGCDMCACNEAPDCSRKPICRMFCEHGFKKGEDGCDKCECNETPSAPQPLALAAPAPPAPAKEFVPCHERPMCLMACQYGFEIGEDGCDICRCKRSPSHCDGRPMCRMYCPHGFQKGPDGCDLCRCA